MALTQIDAYSKPHGSGEGNGGKTIIKGGRGTSTYNSINVSNVNASKGNIDYLTSKSITANDAEIMYLLTREGTILKLSGNELKYNSGYIGDLNSDSIATKKLTTEDLEAVNAYIKSLQSYEITTDYLTVTKQAHFFELIIDKIRSVGGIIILTPASCEIDYVRGHTYGGAWVEPTESNYDNIDYFQVFWRAENADGKSVSNDFKVNDQAICQSFNVHEGVNRDVANKYYWRLVKSVGYDNEHNQVYVNLSTGEISNTESYTTDNYFQIIMYDTQSKSTNGEYYYNNIAWEAKPQQFLDSEGNLIGGIDTNTDWVNGTLSSGQAINGTFKTHSQQYGMYIKPANNNNDLPVTNKLAFNIKQTVNNRYGFVIPDRINIGVYFKDDSYKCWQDVAIDENGNVELDLDDPNTAIEMIIIVSTADVNWHLCNCMTISNVYTAKSENELTTPAASSECDYVLSKKASIPARGDNLVQLGYRASGSSDPDKNRQSAIIIAAYHSPDKQITPPSYAQYMGIDDFDLSSHRKTYFDANSAEFIGTLTVRSGNTETSIDNYIKGKIAEVDLSKMWKNGTIDSQTGMIVLREADNTITFEPSGLIINVNIFDSSGVMHSSTTVPAGYQVRLYATSNSGDKIHVFNYSYNASLDFSGQYNINSLFTTILNVANNSGYNWQKQDIKNISFELWRLASVADGINADTFINQHKIYCTNIKDGIDGIDGESVKLYELNPYHETLMAGLITSIQTSDPSGALGPVPLVYDLLYSVNKIDDRGNRHSLSLSEMNELGMKISISFSSKNGALVDFYNTYNPDTYNNSHIYLYPKTFTWQDGLGWDGDFFRFAQGEGGSMANADIYPSLNPPCSLNNANLLQEMYPNVSSYWDYMKLYMNHSNLCPSWAEVRLYGVVNGQVTIYDRRIVYVQLETGAVFKVMEDKIASAVADSGTGESGASQEWVTNNFTKFLQTAYGFDLKVAGNTVVSSYDAQTIDDKIASIEITDSQINSVLQDNYYKKTEVDGAIQNAIGDPNYFSRPLDLFTDTSFLNDSFYPVTVNVATGTNVEKNGPMVTCQVDCSLDEFTYDSSSRPSWGGLYPQDSHNRGVALICNWNAFCNKHGEWNNNEKNVYINTYELKYTRKSGGSSYDADNTTNNIKVIGGPSDSSGIVQNNGYLIFYLRGGAKYNFRFNWPNLTATIHKTPITINGTTYAVKSESQIYVPELDKMWKSQILQEADRIALNVWAGAAQDDLKKTGIDIQKGVIKLTADNTYIDGNLNIQNPDEGLSIYDENNVPKVSILNKTLGNDPTSISNISYVMWRDGKANAAGQSSFNITGSIDLGAFTSGTNVTLSDFELILSCMVNGVIIDGISSTTTLFSGTISGSHSGTGNISSLNGHSFSGNGNLQKLNFITSGSLNQNASTNGCYIFAKIIGKLTYTSTSGVIIGTDGITSQSSDGSGYAWLTNGKSILYSRNLSDNTQYATLKLEDGKLLRNGGAGAGRQKFGDISSIVNFKVIHNENYYATNDDSMIYIGNSGVGGGNTTNIYLPGGNDSIQGKVFYIKNASTYNVKVYCGDNGKILPANDSSEIDYVDVGNRSHMFICTFQHEYADFYCG